jgi:hypothetical protein
VADPQEFTEELWFRTTTTSGGKLIGFGDAPTGTSNNYDRHIYMLDDGRLTFGLCCPNGLATVTTSGAYNDGSWHHVAASVGPVAGMKLYVDGALTASDASVTTAQNFDGYWRVGGDNLGLWPDEPSSYDFAGDVDEVAVYGTQLSDGRLAAHHSAASSGYAAAVLADSPYLYWRLADAPGSVAADSSGNNHAGSINAGQWPGPTATSGATSDGNAAAHFPGEGSIAGVRPVADPDVFSEEVWFRTTTNSGGKLVGFGNRQVGGSTRYDRHVYMHDDGTLSFGVNGTAGLSMTSTTSAYNDGAWHHVVATCGPTGRALYVDGALQASDGQATGGEDFTGYWRVGGDSLGGWPDAPSSDFFSGDLDDVAVYPTVLTPARVAAHYAGGSGDPAAVLADGPDLFWRLADSDLSHVAVDSGTRQDVGIVAGRNDVLTSVPGPMRAAQTPTVAVHFTGQANMWSGQAVTAPQVFTIECWFRTTTDTGGKLLGFGALQTGNSGGYDRHLYMLDGGQLVFGVFDGGTETVTTSRSYNDGDWHHAAASMGPSGLRLWVDGSLQASDLSITSAASYTGYWRVGGDGLYVSWPGTHTDEYFTGDLAEFAVYPAQLTDEQVRVHAYANH